VLLLWAIIFLMFTTGGMVSVFLRVSGIGSTCLGSAFASGLISDFTFAFLDPGFDSDLGFTYVGSFSGKNSLVIMSLMKLFAP